MGLCFSNPIKVTRNFALKLPHGGTFIEYNEKTKKFILKDDINIWIKNLYDNKLRTNWIIYNDEIDNSTKTSKGHCKGIITWNEDIITWLCHSVPKFPKVFDESNISSIDGSMLIYGQSFQYLEFPFEKEKLKQIIEHLRIMKANVYINNSDYFNNKLKTKCSHVHELVISKNIIHVAKPPKYEIDIYSEYLVDKTKANWKVESWIRSRTYPIVPYVTDIKECKFNTISYAENQDHSKWAVSNKEFYWIGDLNRMTTQMKRGGGGFICKDKKLNKALQKIITH